jgi:ubiquinone/menaquinone biosynthesis C-methylase UbiE
MKTGTSIVSRHAKYTTRNPISRYLTGRFFHAIGELLSRTAFESVLEIGCGEGVLLHSVQEHLVERKVVAADLDAGEIETARKNIPFASCMVASAYDLPFADNEFDLVVCCEVLEHLDRPDRALQEMRRTTDKYCILSVPNEPLWRVLNVVRGAYLTQGGNTPGHINHWSGNSFQNYVAPYFKIIEVIRPLPWVAVLCQRKDRK